MKKPAHVDIERYPGLPRGAFHQATLPPQADAAAGNTDEGVWSAAVTLYLNTVDPRSGRPYNGHPLADVAEGSVRLAASTCHTLAIKYSADADKRAHELEVEAAKHLAAAVDQIEHCAVILDEPLAGPDGEITNGRKIQATQQQDEALAKERSSEGDSRHTQRIWEPAWRLIAATLLGLLDVLLLWKPLLNLTFETNSGSIFRWAIGLGLTGLQVLGIEWAARSYVHAERVSVDRRGAMGDYNRPLKAGRVGAAKPAPDRDELIDADVHMAHAYRALVLIAAFIAVIGGARVAFLAKRAGLAIYEAGLFGTIIGLILGGVVVQMARAILPRQSARRSPTSRAGRPGQPDQPDPARAGRGGRGTRESARRTGCGREPHHQCRQHSHPGRGRLPACRAARLDLVRPTPRRSRLRGF